MVLDQYTSILLKNHVTNIEEAFIYQERQHWQEFDW